MSIKKDAVITIDAGTSSIKIAVVDFEYNILSRISKEYSYSIPREYHVDFDFNILWQNLIEGFKELELNKIKINAIGLSVLCPGLVPLDKNGNPLRPAIIHLDRRSIKESKRALDIIGEKSFLSVCANLPYPGGISLTSMMWIKDNEPQVYKKTFKFGHTNTFIIKKLTDIWAIDPTNASFTGLYNTMKATGWDLNIIKSLGLDYTKLPFIYPSSNIVGKVTEEAARVLDIQSGIPVVAGAGDTACASFGADVIGEGEILNSTGTAEVMALSTEKPVPSANYLIRTHVIPDKWLIMNIIPTGGEAIEWVRRELFRDIEKSEFYGSYLHKILRNPETKVRLKPFFSGDRTSFKQKKAVYSGLSINSKRDDLLKATCNALTLEMKKRFRFYTEHWIPDKIIKYTGGGIKPLLDLKKRAFPDYKWEEVKDATLLGAAKLAFMKLR